MAHKDCDLIARVKWITDAIASQDLGVGVLSSYLIRDGNIHATDGRMVVGTPFPFSGPDVLVPAEPFERVIINRPEGDFDWLFEDGKVILKRGRFKGKIRTLPLDAWVMPTDLPVGLSMFPDKLLGTLRSLLPFVSANATKPWATCVGIIGDHVYASNNIAVARAYCPTGLEWPEYLLPRWVVEFICNREQGLAMWLCEEQRVTFLWEDGSWMRSNLIVDKFPPVQTVLDKFFGDPDAIDVEITTDFRKVLKRIIKIADDPVIRLRENECAGSSGEVLSVEDEAGAPTPDGLTETIWDLRYLMPVLEAATHWNPRTYPQPAPWKGEMLEGIVAGRRD